MRTYNRVTEPGTVLLYDGRLMRVIGIGQGKTVHMRAVEEPPCPECGRPYEVDLLEDCRLFQDNAKPVPDHRRGSR